jgi:hypothetical protein
VVEFDENRAALAEVDKLQVSSSLAFESLPEESQPFVGESLYQSENSMGDHEPGYISNQVDDGFRSQQHACSTGVIQYESPSLQSYTNPIFESSQIHLPDSTYSEADCAPNNVTSAVVENSNGIEGNIIQFFIVSNDGDSSNAQFIIVSDPSEIASLESEARQVEVGNSVTESPFNDFSSQNPISSNQINCSNGFLGNPTVHGFVSPISNQNSMSNVSTSALVPTNQVKRQACYKSQASYSFFNQSHLNQPVNVSPVPENSCLTFRPNEKEFALPVGPLDNSQSQLAALNSSLSSSIPNGVSYSQPTYEYKSAKSVQIVQEQSVLQVALNSNLCNESIIPSAASQGAISNQIQQEQIHHHHPQNSVTLSTVADSGGGSTLKSCLQAQVFITLLNLHSYTILVKLYITTIDSDWQQQTTYKLLYYKLPRFKVKLSYNNLLSDLNSSKDT